MDYRYSGIQTDVAWTSYALLDFVWCPADAPLILNISKLNNSKQPSAEGKNTFSCEV